jgi:two-component system invasion response regulator UvrY
MIPILLADDHDLVRTAVSQMLAKVEDFVVVAEASSGEQALALALEHRPRVVLMDVNMPGMGGIEAARQILTQVPGAQVAALTALSDPVFFDRLQQAGAIGYLSKGCSFDELADAVRALSKGRPYIGAEMARLISLQRLQGHKSAFLEISRREFDVMMLILSGLKPKEIAGQLCLSPKTVSTYRLRLFEKLGVKNDIGLALAAVRQGLVPNEMAPGGKPDV